MNDIHFTKVGGKLIEGYLGDNKEAEILFILKEPNTKNVEEDDGFWFKKVISDENRTANGKRYFNILGSLAEKLLKCNESKTELLKKCAYINLYPFSGENRQSNNYEEVLKALNNHLKNGDQITNKTISESSAYNDIAENRISLINQIIMSGKTKYIVTVREIYNILSKLPSPCDNAKNHYLQLEYGRKHKTTKSFACHTLKNDLMLCEFWHPSYTWINYYYLNKAILNI